MVSVKDYGAEGNGRVDDAPAIRELLKDTSVSEVTFPSGRYLLDSCEPDVGNLYNKNEAPYLWLRRPGMRVVLDEGAVLLPTPQWSTVPPPGPCHGKWIDRHFSVFLITARGITLEGGAIEGFGHEFQWLEKGMLGKRGYIGWLYGVRIGGAASDVAIQGVTIADLHDGVQIVGGRRLRVSDCSFFHCGQESIAIVDVAGLEVENCYAFRSGELFLEPPNWLCRRGKTYLAAYHIEPGGEEKKVRDVSFKHNVAQECARGFYIARMMNAPDDAVNHITLEGNVIRDSNEGAILVRGANHFSIVDNLCVGGTYGVAVEDDDEEGVTREATDGIIRGNTCIGPATRHPPLYAGVSLDRNACKKGKVVHCGPQRIRIANNHVLNGTIGIKLRDPRIVICEANVCVNHSQAGIHAEAKGQPAEPSGAVIRANVCIDNGQKPQGDGISVKNLVDSEITSNVCTNNGKYGIAATGCNNTDIERNRCWNNGVADTLVGP